MNILCCRAWGIGNIIMCTPALLALRKLYPDARIDLISDLVADMLINDPKILDNIYSRWHDVEQNLYDVVIYFHPGSTHYKFPDIPKQIRHKTDNYQISEINSNLDLIARLGDIGDYAQYRSFISSVEVFKRNNERKAICIHMGKAPKEEVDFIRREWIDEYWLELINKLTGKDYKVGILGGKEEEENIKTWFDNYGRSLKHNELVYNFVGSWDIESTCIILSSCDLLITVDSGVMNLGRAAKTPMIVLGGCLHKNKSGPWEDHIRFIYKEVCKYQPCYGVNGHFNINCIDRLCMKAIKPDEIFNIAKELLNERE